MLSRCFLSITQEEENKNEIANKKRVWMRETGIGLFVYADGSVSAIRDELDWRINYRKGIPGSQ